MGFPMRSPAPEEPPEPREKTDWDRVSERADALRLIKTVRDKASPILEELKRVDASGEGDLFPEEKGKVAVTDREVSVPGIGFNKQDVARQDALLKFDPETGAIREFRQRLSRDGETSQIAILQEGDKTTYVSESGMWAEIATESADGTFTREKHVRITEEMGEMLKFQLAMKLASGGGEGLLGGLE
ncbi:MAG: hypothetical protein AB1758_14515 [Candidatus Eremiobacterota bacterium]